MHRASSEGELSASLSLDPAWGWCFELYATGCASHPLLLVSSDAVVRVERDGAALAAEVLDARARICVAYSDTMVATWDAARVDLFELATGARRASFETAAPITAATFRSPRVFAWGDAAGRVGELTLAG